MSDFTPHQTDTGSNAKVIYILYLVSIVVGLTAIIGVVMAYVYRGDAPDWLKTHYRFQIYTFWLGLALLLVSTLLTVVLIGYLLMLFLFVWLVVRCIQGMKYLERQAPVPNPVALLFN